jgi:hypothetical protein
MTVVSNFGPILILKTVRNCFTGHFVPSKGQWRKFFHEYMKDNLADLPSPGFSSRSVPVSGMATPTASGANNSTALMMKL